MVQWLRERGGGGHDTMHMAQHALTDVTRYLKLGEELSRESQRLSPSTMGPAQSKTPTLVREGMSS